MYVPNFPMGYQNPYQYQAPQTQYQQTQQLQPQNTPPIQNGGFVSVPSEDVARNYPVAPGNCVTFKIENQPVVIEKSMGFSQLDSPRIAKYQLVPMEQAAQAPLTAPAGPETVPPDKSADYVLKSDYDALKDLVGYLDEKVQGLESHIRKPAKKAKLTEDREVEE